MHCLIWLLLFVVLFGLLVYRRMSLMPATSVLALFMMVWTLFGEASTFISFSAWLVFLLIAVPINHTPWRRALISDRLLVLFRRVLPTMSQTEREALEAGTVWWDGELFSGRPDWKKMLAYPVPTLSADEQAFIDGPLDELCRMLDDWDITEHRRDLPPEVWQFIKDNGFFGMIIPKEYGGLAFSALAHSTVVMTISSRSISTAVTVMVPNSLGPAELLLSYGTDAQKDHYLPRLAKGLEIPCFALTAPRAGSDAGAIPDNGVVCYEDFEGKKTLGIRLNWDKRYITLGPVATLLGLAFKLFDPDHLLGDEESLGITLALIPTDTKGVRIGNRHAPLNMAFQNGPNWGTDVFIPMDWVIGGQDMAGQGWRMLMECLAAGRSISLPALSTGAGKLASRATGSYARIRKQFKMPIGKFEGVEEALTRIAGNTYMLDAARCMTAGAIDLGAKPSVVSAIVKYNMTERMRGVVNDAMDTQGGSGICLGPRNLLGRAYQSVPISITVEGANILTRTLIIFGQGAIRCHPYVLKEMTAVNQSDAEQAASEFDTALFGHIGFSMSNAVRAFFMGLTGSIFTASPVSGAAAPYYKKLNRMSVAFALMADIAMLVLGGSLKRREKLSGRLADVLSHLYMASATLKHFQDQGCQKEDLPLMQWSCEESLHVMEKAMDEFIDNFPNRPAAWLLRFLVFPLGKSYKAPNDKLGHKVAQIILSPSSARDRLTQGVYINNDPEDRIGRLEVALPKVIAAEAVEQKISSAVREGILSRGDEDKVFEEAKAQDIITEVEAEIYQAAVDARLDVIQVDNFETDRS